MRVVVALLLTTLVLAGCASTPPTADPSSSAPGKQLDQGVNKLDVPTLPATPPAAGERTLAKVPQWKLGEYWTYHIVDGFTGHEYDVTRVVAGTDGANYLVGFPLEAFSNDILIFHIPGYGDVSQTDLSFEVHDKTFAPLKFPLEGTNQWPTQFEGRDGTVTVEKAEGGKADFSASGSGWTMTYTYDAEAGEVTKLNYPGYASYEVTKHGYNYAGLVRVPHAHDLIFFNGRVAGALDVNLQPSTSPTSETVQIAPGYDHLAFTIIVGNLFNVLPGTTMANPSSEGYYSEKVTSPNGTVFQVVSTPADPALKLQFFGTGEPTGTWTLEHIAAGPGQAFVEGIGYHSIDVSLPSGCVVQSVNAGHHGAPCKVTAAQAGDAKPL